MNISYVTYGTNNQDFTPRGDPHTVFLITLKPNYIRNKPCYKVPVLSTYFTSNSSDEGSTAWVVSQFKCIGSFK